jgi:hypothetical protein
MTKENIQALVDHGLLRTKAEVEWKAPSSDAFSMEDDKKRVVFMSYFDRSFNIPAATSSGGSYTIFDWILYTSSPTLLL